MVAGFYGGGEKTVEAYRFHGASVFRMNMF